MFPFLHENVGNIVQLPLFHLNKSQETIRLRLSVILGLVEFIRWPHPCSLKQLIGRKSYCVVKFLG